MEAFYLGFQSTVDRHLAARVLACTGQTYLKLIREDDTPMPDGKPPPVLPIVIHNGRPRWSAPEEVGETIAAVGSALAPFQPRQRYLLIDEHAMRAEDLPAGNVVSAQIELEQGPVARGPWRVGMRAEPDDMPKAKVLVECSGAVRTVTLNRPEKRNALDQEMLDGLRAAFPAEPPAAERVAVLRAAGPVFCAGMDLAQRSRNLGRPTPIVDALRAIEGFPLPVVAVVQGHAIAGGNEIALHCDLVVASAAANFGMSLAQVGLAPTWFLAKKIVEKGGPAAAREILLLGDPIPARRMYALGMIARVVEPADLEAEAKRIVDRLAANAPLSVRIMKRTLVRLMEFRDPVPHDDLDAEVRRVSASDDAREGIAARLERRTPSFRGT